MHIKERDHLFNLSQLLIQILKKVKQVILMQIRSYWHLTNQFKASPTSLLITRLSQINLLSMTSSLKIKLLTYGDKRSSCLQAAEIGSDSFVGRKLGIVVHLGAPA